MLHLKLRKPLDPDLPPLPKGLKLDRFKLEDWKPTNTPLRLFPRDWLDHKWPATTVKSEPGLPAMTVKSEPGIHSPLKLQECPSLKQLYAKQEPSENLESLLRVKLRKPLDPP